jgi:gluconokinase
MSESRSATSGMTSMKSPVWRHVLLAALDPPVGLAASPEGAGTGAGLLGHYALGSSPDLDRAADLIAVDRGEPPHPDAWRHCAGCCGFWSAAP